MGGEGGDWWWWGGATVHACLARVGGCITRPRTKEGKVELEFEFEIKKLVFNEAWKKKSNPPRKRPCKRRIKERMDGQSQFWSPSISLVSHKQWSAPEGMDPY